jgi:hypothetical protein
LALVLQALDTVKAPFVFLFCFISQVIGDVPE